MSESYIDKQIAAMRERCGNPDCLVCRQTEDAVAAARAPAVPIADALAWLYGRSPAADEVTRERERNVRAAQLLANPPAGFCPTHDRVYRIYDGCPECAKARFEACAHRVFVRVGEDGICPDCGYKLPSPEPEPDTTFRDAVIAGLRERGWPEPTAYASDASAEWNDPAGIDPYVIFDVAGYVAIDYGTGGSESGDIRFDADPAPSAERVVEAIDRLRWVVGLAPRGLIGVDLARGPDKILVSDWEYGKRTILPLPAPPLGLAAIDKKIAEAYRLAKWFNLGNPSAPGKAEDFVRPPRWGDLTLPDRFGDPTQGLHPIGGMGVPHEACTCRNCRKARMVDELDGSDKPPEQLVRLGRENPEKWSPVIDRYMKLLAGRGDRDGPLVALPAKPAPKEDPPYVPTRWFGEDG